MNSVVEKAKALAELVTEHALRSEQQCYLCAEVAAAFAKAGLYRIAIPENYGGAGESPDIQIRTIEAISYADGAAGWNLMIGIESFGLLSAGLEQCKTLVADTNTILCSSTAAIGRADKVEGGYNIQGQWPFVSGCHNAHLFAATVRLHDQGVAMSNNSNCYALLPKSAYSILETWKVAGLRGSGSHDILVTDQFVPDEHMIAPIGGLRSDSPLESYPLGARLAYNKVAVSLGIAQRAIDEFIRLAANKNPRFTKGGLNERVLAQEAVAKAQVRVLGIRTLLLHLAEQFWEDVCAKKTIDMKSRAIFQAAASDGARGCCEAVDALCEAAGTSANQQDQPLEKLARDIRVIRQHFSVAPHHIADSGRVLLGLEPQGAMLKNFK